MTPDISGVPGLIALGAKQLAAFRARAEVRSLLKLTASEIGMYSEVPPKLTPAVKEKILGLGTDPEVMGGVKRLLDEGDLGATSLIEKRLQQLLGFESDEIQRCELAGPIAKALEDNVAAAKKDDRSAGHVDAQMTRSLLREEIGGLRDEITAEAERKPPGAGASTLHVKVEFAFSFTIRTERVLSDLEGVEPDAATKLAAAIDAGGLGRARELIETPQEWVSRAGSELHIALGRLADQAGDYEAAQAAYLRAAEMPDVKHRSREIVSAAVSAELAGSDGAAIELYAKAEEIDPGSPTLAIAKARRIEDPEQILATVAEVEPLDDAQGVLLELTRAGAESSRREFARARAHLEAAASLDPESLMVKEVAANVALIEAQSGLNREQELDRSRLRAAATDLEGIAVELGRDGRSGAEATLLARAAQALELAGETDSAVRLLERALALGPPEEAAPTIGEAALLLQRFEVVATLPLGEGEEGQLIRASAEIFSETNVVAAAATTEALISSPDPTIRHRAAFLRMGASSPAHEVAWSEEAAEIVAADNPEAAAMVRSQFLAEEDCIEEAERVLAPHASSPAVLNQLADFAQRRGDLETALRLTEELLSRRSEPHDLLNRAGLLARAGDLDAARDQFLLLARDAESPGAIRIRAYRRAASLEVERGDFLAAARISEEWLGLEPDSVDAIWLHLFALARRREHGLALAFWREHEIDIDEERQALLLAEIFAFGDAPTAEALTKLAELSDRFGRSERLEYGLMMAALQTEGTEREEILPKLDARIKDAFAEFPERFPNSRLIQAHQIDSDDPAGSFLEEIGPQLKARAERGAQLAEELRRGEIATAVIAESSGRSIGQVWGALGSLPLGYSEEQRSAAERNAAADALDARAAVWDQSAMYVTGGLGEPLAKLVRNVLTASVIVESTFEDATSDEVKMADRATGHISFDPGSGGFVMGELSDTKREIEGRRIAGMAEMARGITVRPDLGEPGADDQRYREMIEVPDLSAAARSWPATIALSRREGLAVYSDDRYVRLSAQQAGGAAFGTLALLDVLAERGLIPNEQRLAARARLYRTGAWGLALTRTEFAEHLRDDDFEPTRGSHAVLNDFSAWPAGGIEAVEDVLAQLEMIHTEAPEKFDLWVHRVLDSLAHSLSGGYEKWARFLTQAALNPFRDPPPISPVAIRALLPALRSLRFFKVFPPDPDLVLGAIAESLSLADDERARAFYFKALLELLGPEDREAAIKTFVAD